MTVNLRVKKKHIDDKAIDGSKIELLSNEALVAQDPSQANAPVDLLKIDANGKVLSKGQEIAYKFQVDAEESSRQSADFSLETRLSSEESTRAFEDYSLENRISTEVSAEESARQSADYSLENRISTEVSAEESSRQSADFSLETRLSSEESVRASADYSLESRISTEESARASAIYSAVADLAGTSPTILSTLGQIATALSDGDAATGILNALESENSQRVSADFSLETRLSSEESVRGSADTSLTSRLSLEESVRSSADFSLETRLSSEESTRAFEDYSLTSRLSLEESVRSSADYSLESRISTEESARASAIYSAIADLAGTSPTVLSTLGQIATALSDGDAATGILNALESENSQRVSADYSLTSRISSEESARASADYSLESRISTLGSAFSKYYKNLTQTDVDNEYVDLPFKAVDNSIVAAIDRLMIHEGADYDFTTTTVNGVTRITFLNSLVDNGKEKLVAGDILFVKYTKS